MSDQDNIFRDLRIISALWKIYRDGTGKDINEQGVKMKYRIMEFIEDIIPLYESLHGIKFVATSNMIFELIEKMCDAYSEAIKE